jgi:hypothetical protein
MKKIPTLFEREFKDHRVVVITPKVTPGLEWVLDGKGVATEKIDGSCTAIINGVLYKRYDAKKGKKAPEGAIPCCDPDPITGHHPHWVKVNDNCSADKWFVEAFWNSIKAHIDLTDGTYEAVGIHFQGNPHEYECDMLVKHGEIILDVPRTFEGIKQYLTEHYIEGIVFWLDGEPRCKIKRSDFGLEWG